MLETSRSALGFMAHAGPQRRGIVREHFVAKGILKQKKVPSNIEYLHQFKMSSNSNAGLSYLFVLSRILHLIACVSERAICDSA